MIHCYSVVRRLVVFGRHVELCRSTTWLRPRFFRCAGWTVIYFGGPWWVEVR